MAASRTYSKRPNKYKHHKSYGCERVWNTSSRILHVSMEITKASVVSYTQELELGHPVMSTTEHVFISRGMCHPLMLTFNIIIGIV